jgi:ketosteroid isomerase-like protein
MSQANIDTLREGYRLFNRGEFDEAAALWHPDIEFFPPGDQPPYKGARELRAWMEPDAFDEQLIEPLSFTVSGDTILVEQDVKARGAGSGIELETRSWNVWTFDDDGLIVRVQTFLEHEKADALEAAGLEE